MAEDFSSLGKASIMGLSTTSFKPLPKAYSTTAAKIPQKALANIWGSKHKAKNPGNFQRCRRHHTGSIPNFVRKFGACHIHKQLHCKIDRHQRAKLRERNSILTLKRDKQQRKKIIHHRCRHISSIARIYCMFIIPFYSHTMSGRLAPQLGRKSTL